MTIHPLAAEGFGTPEATASYERGRTGLPPPALRHVADVLALGPGVTVADVGAGTGKLSRLLAESGARVFGVEPVGSMRAVFRERCRLPVVGATAEALPFPAQSLGAITAAQAFHWFDGPRALAEFARVLRPGAGLALVWSGRETSDGWTGRIDAVVEAVRGPEPSAWSGRWFESFSTAAAASFTPLEYAAFDYPFETTAANVVDRFASVSFIAVLPPPRRAAVLDEIRGILRGELGAEGDDLLVYPYTSHVFWCHRA